MPLISAYIIAFNEAEKVRAAIESVRWADEIVVVDSWSTDGTAELAAKLGAKVVQVTFQGFGDLRNQAIAACVHLGFSAWMRTNDVRQKQPKKSAVLPKTPTRLTHTIRPGVTSSWAAGSVIPVGTLITANPSFFEMGRWPMTSNPFMKAMFYTAPNL
ncbi:MAG: hypothetical protein RL420_221 [Pseudomonadota bacterium]|jgi:glycosyltransferase involved in cell wall biosynthesis